MKYLPFKIFQLDNLMLFVIKKLKALFKTKQNIKFIIAWVNNLLSPKHLSMVTHLNTPYV